MPFYDMQWHAAHSIEPEDITATCDESTTHAESSSEIINNTCRNINSFSWPPTALLQRKLLVEFSVVNTDG
eukprot:scaffold37838_cov58-Phaeocystis_antarctica.AAC.1